MTDGLRLEVGGDHTRLAAESVHKAMGAALALLTDAAEQVGATEGSWTFEKLQLGSATMVLVNSSAEDVVPLVAAGVDSLRQSPSIPEGWSQDMVRHVQKIGKLVGRKGVESISLGRKDAAAVLLDGTVTAHAEAAIAPQAVSLGSVVGTVDKWQVRKGRSVGLTLDSGETVQATYPAELTQRIVDHAVGHRVVISGEIHRNAAGQRVRIHIDEVEPVERRMPPMDIREVAGLYADLVDDGLTVESFVEHRD